MRRAAHAGGTVAVYVWDYAGEMQLMRKFWDAAVALETGGRELDESLRFPGCRPEALLALSAGRFARCRASTIDVPTVFRI